MSVIGALGIFSGPGFLVPFIVLAIWMGLLVSPVPDVRRTPARHLLLVLIGLLVGAGFGWLTTWLFVDVANVFGTSLTTVVRLTNVFAWAGVGIGVVNLWRTAWWRKVLGILAPAILGLCLALNVNVDYAQYRTLGDALQLTYRDAAQLPAVVEDARPAEDWSPEPGLPAVGRVGSVRIPGTESGFPARDAYVYLPPAAFAEEPPALPVVVALAGQPGETVDLFRSAHLDELLDEFAADRGGLAPIVVVPDQLADPQSNPMCVDGPLGNSATYLSADVPAWIRANLNVSADAADWTIGGFSQGGTCAIQLGAEHPDLFGAIVDVSGEEAPTLGSRERTIDAGFEGSESRYLAATPRRILAAGAPYADTVAVFAAGEDDAEYSATMRTVAGWARQAGMSVTTLVSPGTGHDWHTVTYAFDHAVGLLADRWGIPS